MPIAFGLALTLPSDLYVACRIYKILLDLLDCSILAS